MNRIDRIFCHPTYQACLKEIQKLEADRIFCRHTPQHFLDVARISWIKILEEGYSVDKSIIYGAALLHDIGRHLQYLKGIPHHEASLTIAGKILPECGFSTEETEAILALIASHRDQEDPNPIHRIFYQADKESRACYLCQAQKDCKWSPQKKNMTIRI